uniref:sickle tail protein-like n=1 Tax=Semicossyphus pulcher TaxID=241346 RepID=UPI0037E9348A
MASGIYYNLHRPPHVSCFSSDLTPDHPPHVSCFSSDLTPDCPPEVSCFSSDLTPARPPEVSCFSSDLTPDRPPHVSCFSCDLTPDHPPEVSCFSSDLTTDHPPEVSCFSSDLTTDRPPEVSYLSSDLTPAHPPEVLISTSSVTRPPISLPPPLDYIKDPTGGHNLQPCRTNTVLSTQEITPAKPGSPWCSDGPPSAGGLEEQQDPQETMSDGELPPPSDPFTRGCKTRASLPVGRSGGHTGERQHGMLYLQHGEETKQVRMPAEISSRDTLRALFVTAFPHQLTMKMLQSPNVAIYIKDTSRNFYYELEDIRNISSHSCLKVYHKDPAHVFNRNARPVITEGRISKEVLYGSLSPVHSRSSSGRSTLHSLQGSMSPPMVRSMPSSPSRRAYGGGSTGGGAGDPGSSTLPRERLSGAGLSRSLCTNSSSSILERRDVKPDEDSASSKSMALVLHGEGGPHYSDSYCSSLQDGGGGRLSISSSQCSAPPSLASDLLDSGAPGIPGGLQQYRATIKPLMGYGETLDQQTRSLHRQKSRKYGENQLPPLGTKTPPPSPQRVSDVRLTDGQIIGGVGLVSAERMSPIRRSLRRDSNGTAEIVNRSRGSGSSTSSVFVDSPLGTPDRPFQGHVTASTAQSERMKAMEEQIASLAGLVHHALSMGADIPGVKEVLSESAGRRLLNNRPGASPEPLNPAALIDSFKTPPLALQAPPPDSDLQQSLMLAKRNVCELRVQLNQLRHLQLLNQQSVSSMLRTAGQELLLLMCDRVNQSEEVFRRREELEEERILYLTTEETVLTQLSELEDYVDHLQRSSFSSPGQLSITLRDVEEAAVNLRRVGEALAVLKGEFPELQVKLRSVLRLEVDAVRFLKEEPHKMDAMLKRVRGLTEALSSLRRCVSESTPPGRLTQVEVPLKEADQGPLKTSQSSPKPQPRSSVRPPLQAPPPSEVSIDGSASPVLVRRIKSTGVQPSHQHHPSPPLTPTHGRDSPTVAKVSPCSREGSPALQRRPGPGPGPESCTDQSTLTFTHTHTETAHRQPPEGSQSTETSTVNPSRTRPGAIQPPRTSTHPDPQRSISTGGRSEDRSFGLKPAPESEQATPQDTPETKTSEQQEVPARLSDGVDSSHITPADTATAASQPPTAGQTAPPSAPPSAPLSSERSSRPQVEKPRRSSVEKELKQSPDRAGRSPPPPPPRRFHAVGSGVSTARSGEEELTRREPLGAQDEAKKDQEPPMLPQPKPPRQPPEVKPKPLLSAPPAAVPPVAASANQVVKEEDREESSLFMKELQVTTELSNENSLSCRNKKLKGVLKTTKAPQVTNQKPSEPQVPPQPDDTYPCPQKLNEQHREVVRDSVNPEKNRNAEVVQQVLPFNCATVKKMEEPLPVASQDVKTAQKKEEVKTPTKAEKMKMPPPVALRDGQTVQKKKEVKTPHKAEKKKIPPPVALRDIQTVQKKEEVKTPTKAEKMKIPPPVALRDVQTVQKKEEVKMLTKAEKMKIPPPVALRDVQSVQKKEEVKTPTIAEKMKIPPPVALPDVQTVQKKEEVKTPTQKKAEKTEEVTLTAPQKENYVPKHVVGQVCSPTTAEKKFKLTTIVTLQKDNNQTGPEQTQEKAVREAQAEKKSNLMVVVTLQKENTAEDCLVEMSAQSQQDESLSSDQDCAAFAPALKRYPISPDLSYRASRAQQNQEESVQELKDKLQNAEDGGSLSPDICDDEGPPPPPPPTSKIGLRISKTSVRTLSKEEDLTKTIGSDTQTVAIDGTSEPTNLGHENQGFEYSDDFDRKPIIVILNEPMDFQTAYKRLSTIFESEEDLDRILSPENLMDEEELQQEEQKQGMNIINITDIRSGLGLRESLNPENQDQGKPEPLRKTETKRKFKFKFPKNKLAAISQALRTGATKAGKKTLEVVVYEEEEEMASDSSPVIETTKHTKESKRFEINSTKQSRQSDVIECDRDINDSYPIQTRDLKSQIRVKELCRSAFESIDSLEESIKLLEISVDGISAPSSPSSTVSSPPQSPDASFNSSDGTHPKDKVKRERERSPSKRPASQILKGPNPPESKRAKPQTPPDTGKTSTKKQTSSSSSSAQRSHTKSRHSSSAGSEKTPKNQQANQKQPSQPRVVAIPR